MFILEALGSSETNCRREGERQARTDFRTKCSDCWKRRKTSMLSWMVLGMAEPSSIAVRET